MSTQPTRSSLLLMAVAGLASALLSLTGAVASLGEFAVGLCFGVALAVYFAAYERFRRPLALAAFISACTAAYPLAVEAALKLMDFFPGNRGMDSAKTHIPMPVFFGAGWLGGFLVLTAGLLLFGSRTVTWLSLAKAVAWSIGGGILGVVGGGADGIRTQGTYRTMLLLYVIWQPGVAVALGRLLQRERNLAVGIAKEQVPAEKPVHQRARGVAFFVSVIFFLPLLAFLSFFVYRTIQSKRTAARWAAAYDRYISEAPPISNSPRMDTMPLGQALVIQQIDGLSPWLPGSGSSPQLSRTQPPLMNYYVGYTTTENPYFGSDVRRVIAVGVTQLPSPEWARYRVRYPPINVAIDSPQALTRVQKFGQTIVQDTHMRYPNGSGTLCFLWPSENFAVSICYESPKVDEEFLRLYLQRYPSSL